MVNNWIPIHLILWGHLICKKYPVIIFTTDDGTTVSYSIVLCVDLNELRNLANFLKFMTVFYMIVERDPNVGICFYCNVFYVNDFSKFTVMYCMAVKYICYFSMYGINIKHIFRIYMKFTWQFFYLAAIPRQSMLWSWIVIYNTFYVHFRK